MNEMAKEILEYVEGRKAAERKARATARAAANAEVAQVARVGKHLDQDDLDDVWQEKYDATFQEAMWLFEATEIDRLYTEALRKELFRKEEEPGEEPIDPQMSDDYVLFDDLPPASTPPPPHICHECQSRPCRCEEFARRTQNRVLLEAALMDDLMKIQDDYEDNLDNACSTCHNWPCVCRSSDFDGF